MDQSDLTLAQALLDCLDQPAFLLEDGVILSKNAQADEAEEALRELLRRIPFTGIGRVFIVRIFRLINL